MTFDTVAVIKMDRDKPPLRFRSDGWTPARQAVFVAARARGATIAAAAAAAGMSRRAAYRLRDHPAGAAVAAVWFAPRRATLDAAAVDAALARAMAAPVVAPARTDRLLQRLNALRGRAKA